MIEADSVGLVSYAVAFGGGLVSFASPCVLPVVPGYLSVLTGLEVPELEQSHRANALPILRDTSLFVGGFGLVFVMLGISATALGSVVLDHQLFLTRLSGALVLGMALFMIGSIYAQAPWLYQEKRFHPQLGRFGRAAPAVAGVAFGFGWTPCIGPILTSILAIAATSGRASTGAALLGVYALGLGLPFLITGLLFGRLSSSLAWVRDHLQQIVLGSAAVLGVFGVLLIFNRLIWVTSQLQEALRAVGLGDLVELG